MCIWLVVLVVSLFLLTFHKTQAGKVAKFMTTLALVLFCRASNTFQVGRIATFATSIFLLVCSSGVKALLVVACLPLICVFVLYRHWLCLGLLLLVFTMWELSALVSHEVNLGNLHITCHLLDMPGCSFWALIFLCKLAHLACWEFVQIYTSLINGFRYKFFFSQVEPKDVPVQDLQSFRCVFCQIDLGLYTVVPFIHTFGPWQKLVSKLDLACTSLD